MNLLGATPLLAAVLLAGGHPGAKPAPHPASIAVSTAGVGAQLGIAGVLLYDYSDASTDGRRIALALIGIVAMFLLYYSTTAIRALADPQPGSSMSAVPGTSFTL
jgi:hypothetical protein